jgi:5'-deoxynucleotidase YfbR-like HD superfamily hydrolase
MDPQEVIRIIREAGHVKRCHTLPHHGSYNIAEHSWQAAMLLLHLHPNPSLDLVKAVMFHDVAERYCGDMPAPTKWAHPKLAEAQEDAEVAVLTKLGLLNYPLSLNDLAWLSAVDKLELLLWAYDQEALGNLHVMPCLRALRTWFNNGNNLTPPEVLRFVESYSWKRNNDQLP